MSVRVTYIFQFALFLFEYLAWQLDLGVYTTHGHHREVFGQNLYFLLIQINSLPHLAAAYAYSHRIKWAMFVYIPYLLLFSIGQLFTWWLPYFFQIGLWHIDDNGEKLSEYKRYHSMHHRILPPWNGHPIIPDTEHTILGVLTCITFLLTIRSLFSIRTINYNQKKMN